MYWGDDETRAWNTPTPHWAYTLVTPPTMEPWTVAEAKDWLRIATDDEDAQVQSWIRTAREVVEHDAAVVLSTSTWDLALDAFPSGRNWQRILKRPLQSVTYIKYTDSVGVLQTLNASNYLVDLSSRTPRIGLTTNGFWGSDVRFFQPITIRLVAGYADPEQIPGGLVHAMRLQLMCIHEHRGLNDEEQRTYDALIAPHALAA